MQSEPIFNIFPQINKNDTVEIYKVKCYYVQGTEIEKQEFLKSCVLEDYNDGESFKINVAIDGDKSQNIVDSETFYLLQTTNFPLFEEAFAHFSAPKNPLTLVTPVINGVPKITTKYKTINKLTLNAIISRGIDIHAAKILIIKGYNLKKLQQTSDKKLSKLGLSAKQIEILRNEKRPTISSDIVAQLLYESKRTCCVCRDPSRSIIIHHIDKWAISKSHSIENLVVLCLEHHNEAHTKKELSLNLDKKQLLHFKHKWLEHVKYNDSKAVLGLINNYSRWDFYNLPRILEMFLELDVDFRDIKTFSSLRDLNIINEIGTVNSHTIWKINTNDLDYFCDFGEGIMLNFYLKTIVERIVSKLPVIDMTNKMTKADFKSLLSKEKFFTAQIGFYFSNIQSVTDNNNLQLRKAYYRGHGIVITFQFDTFYCSSSTAKHDHLNGHKVINPILLIKSVTHENNELIVNCSCLAIGSYFDNNKMERMRYYEQPILGEID